MTVINPSSKNIGGLVDGAKDVKVLSGSTANSDGFTLIDQGIAVYIPKTIDDTKAVIDQQSKAIDEIVKIIDQITQVLSDIVAFTTPVGAAMIIGIPGQSGLPTGLIPGFTGGTTLETNLNNIKTQLNQIKTDTNQIKTDNNTLKDNLK